MDGLTEGRMVHYVTADMHRAAVITKVWGNPKVDGTSTVNLFVFPDGSYPLSNNTPTSVMFNADGAPNTWHWIEKVVA